MTYIINWIKFKVQKALGIHELIEKVEILERECIDLSAQLGSTTGETFCHRQDIKELFAITSELRGSINQLDTSCQVYNDNEHKWEKEEEINFIQKSYE